MRKKIDVAIRNADAMVLGLSAGSLSMAKRSLDTKESPVPYDGLGLADITVKPHFKQDDQQVLNSLGKQRQDLTPFTRKSEDRKMIDTQLIMLEGLPSTGKTTTTEMIYTKIN
jgi:peptidase E